MINVAQLNKTLYEDLNKNIKKKPTVAFSLRPTQRKKIKLVVVGRAPTSFKDSQGNHVFAMSAIFRSLELLLLDVTVNEAVEKICSFHSAFLFLYRVSYGDLTATSYEEYGDLNQLIVDAGAIVNELGNGTGVGTIFPEMICPYIQEYLTICAYILNHLPETSVKLSRKSLNKGEGTALEKLTSMNKTTFDREVFKSCLSKLVDSDAIEEFVKQRKINNQDPITIIFHQIVHIHCLLLGLGNLSRNWLAGANLLTGGSSLSKDLKNDLRGIIFSKLKNFSQIEQDNLIQQALMRLSEYSELEAWHASRPNYKTYVLH